MTQKTYQLPTRSPWQQHCAKWSLGCGSSVCSRVTKIVLGRGTVPADVCIIGESPGASEDVIGLPFQGPAGHLLNSIIERSLPNVKVAITNLVGCLPLNDKDEKDEPDPDQIKQCRPRLEEFVALASPSMIVTVGVLATSWTDKGYKTSPKLPDVPRVSITHPAAILRMPVAAQGLNIKKCVVNIATMWKKVLEGTIEPETEIPF